MLGLILDFVSILGSDALVGNNFLLLGFGFLLPLGLGDNLINLLFHILHIFTQSAFLCFFPLAHLQKLIR